MTITRKYFDSREELDKYLTKTPGEKILKIGYEQGIHTNGKEQWFVEEQDNDFLEHSTRNNNL